MDSMNPMDPTPTTPTEPAIDPAAQQAALDKLLAVAGKNYDGDKMAALKEKLKKFAPASEQKTLSGAEAVEAAPAPENQRALTGRDVDWSAYNLDFNVAHLYANAVYRDTPQGPHWVAMVTDFWSTQRDFRNHGKKVNAPGSNDGKETEALNLGEYLNDMVNGREQWKIAAVMPAGTGACGLLLERQVPIILPDPQPLKTKEEVAAPTNQDLKATEDAALEFMAENGLDSGASVGDDTTSAASEDIAKEIGLRPIERGTDEYERALAELDEDGAVVERRTSKISQAIDLNRATTVPAPVEKGIQDAPIENPVIGGAPNAAAGYSAAADLLRALNDPKYRASLPTEE
jgi:hypothetical protein